MHSTLERAKRLSLLMQRALLVIGVAIAAMALWFSVRAAGDPAWVNALLKGKYGAFGPDVLSSGQVIGLIAVFLLQVGLLLLALRALWQAFGLIASNEGISVQTARWIRMSGIWFGAATLMMILSHPLNSLIASIGAGAGRQFLSISLESQHLLAFLLSAVLLVFGHVLALAADIADDNRQIV